mmetsp:Transcript_20955/g.70362  ORF Transcript_20955/g.70362 Transcript_20955/m.70362 type:complete len:417 (-) Transcript_20955:241-1491(-)
MGDVRDILGVAKRAGPAAPKAVKPREKKPEGVSREVYALLDKNQDVPLVPTDLALKEKRFSGRVSRWAWRGFTSSARTDGLVLGHWVQATDKSADYKFARFNKTVHVPKYTDEEYDALLTDPDWPREKTDRLMALVKRFDMRFVVVHDRWEGPETVEDLKGRYYAVARALARARLDAQREGKRVPPGEKAVAEDDPELAVVYDKAHEQERKAAFEAVYRRDPAQVREELRLLEQARTIELRLKEARRQQLRALKQQEDALASGKAGAGTSAAGSAAASAMKAAKARLQGPVLRSSELTTRRLAADKGSERLEARLRDLGVPLRPLSSKETVPVYNAIRSSVVQLLELEAKLKKLEGEAKALETRKASFLKQGGGGGKTAAAGAGGSASGSKRNRGGAGEGEAGGSGRATDKRSRKS